jgi:hypothetical protein
MIRAAVLAIVTAVSACPPGDIKDPRYWGDLFLDKYAVERQRAIDELEAGPAPVTQPRTVLLITGVTIPAAWFEPIVVRLERDGFRPVVYEPPALLSGDLFDNARALGTVIERVRAESGQDKIDILAECTGGLIARHYIQAMGGDRYVRRMVTFISPQHGVAKAPWAFAIAGWPALDDLSPGSEFLETVNAAPLPAAVRWTSIYSCTDEYIQPYQTSIIPGAHNIGLCDGFVGHYQFFYDPAIYRVMHGALIEPFAGDDPMAPEAAPAGDPADAPPLDDAAGCAAAGGAASGAERVIAAATIALARRRRRAR